MRRLEVLGWWFHERTPDVWPRPQRLVGRWRAKERAAVLGYLAAGRTLVTYPRGSCCRFACGTRAMGNRDLTDGTFVWPDGLLHYVERHGVRLPERFVARALAGNGVVRPFALPEPRSGLFDAEPWLRWARAQGACLDLDGWAVPDAASKRRIRAGLGPGRAGAIVLCHAGTREVVLARRDGSLEVHQLRTGGHPPRTLGGWDDWPVAR